MSKERVRKRSSSAAKSRGSSKVVWEPTLEKSVSEARKVLQEGITSVPTPNAAFKGLGALADTLLTNIEKFAKGEVTLEQLLQSQRAIPNAFRAGPPKSIPSWLSPELAHRILDLVAGAEPEGKKRARELSVWLTEANPAVRGAPWRPENYLLGLHAQELYDSMQPKSWMKVALKTCSQRGPGHRCTKACADRIMKAAAQSKKLAV